MREYRTAPAVFATSLLVLITLMVMVPTVRAEDYDNILIDNDEYWSIEIDGPGDDEGDIEYEIFVDDPDGKAFDVYVLSRTEMGRYKNGENFVAVISHENIDSNITFDFSIGSDDGAHFLVVDNLDNPHEGDAYANEAITVDINIERDEWIDWDLLFTLLIGAFCVLPIVVVIVILLWIFVEPRWFPQAKSSKYRNLTKKPAFQIYPVNPPLELSPPPLPEHPQGRPEYPQQPPQQPSHD